MLNEIYKYIPEPKEVFIEFAEISAIPRESHHEEAIADFMVEFAKSLNLFVHRDEVNNIIIKKPGTAGLENLPPLIIQGHMDMVCVKKENVEHDFAKDPIRWRVDGDYLYADGTTLGADNGIAVAYAMALLRSTDIPHPPLEILLTTAEETGMQGAENFKADMLAGRTLLNIDSEDEGIFLASCAGGCNLIIDSEIDWTKDEGDVSSALAKNGKYKFYRINIDGLLSGHSGVEIVKQRANAIQLLGRVLQRLNGRSPLNIVNVKGGIKHNAIAASAEALIRSDVDIVEMQALVDGLNRDFLAEYQTTDGNICVSLHEETSVSAEQPVWSRSFTARFIALLFQLPHGVVEMSPEIVGMVRTSLNLGILKSEDNKVEFLISIRSSLASQKEFVRAKLIELSKAFGFNAEIFTDYPAWEYAAISPIRDLALKAYKDLTGTDGQISAIHAGLECGLLGEKIPDADMLSFGPNIYDVHTYNEHLSIKSVGNVWEFIKHLLQLYR